MGNRTNYKRELWYRSQAAQERLLNEAYIQAYFRRSQRAAELCHEALETADYSTTHLRAHDMLAELEFPARIISGLLARIHEHLKPATYLEDRHRSGAFLRNCQARNVGPRESIRIRACRSHWGPASGCSHRPAMSFLNSAM